jgi:hypothetical protein
MGLLFFTTVTIGYYTVSWLLNFCSDLLLIPLILVRSSTDWKGPFFSRYSMIAFAFAFPIPLTDVSAASSALLIFTCAPVTAAEAGATEGVVDVAAEAAAAGEGGAADFGICCCAHASGAPVSPAASAVVMK